LNQFDHDQEVHTIMNDALSNAEFTSAHKSRPASKRSVLGLPFDRINWITSSFLIVTLLITLTAVPLYLYHFGLDWFQVALFFAMLWACGDRLSSTLLAHYLPSEVAGEAFHTYLWRSRF
jgi:hypothetical protein